MLGSSSIPSEGSVEQQGVVVWWWWGVDCEQQKAGRGARAMCGSLTVGDELLQHQPLVLARLRQRQSPALRRLVQRAVRDRTLELDAEIFKPEVGGDADGGDKLHLLADRGARCLSDATVGKARQAVAAPTPCSWQRSMMTRSGSRPRSSRDFMLCQAR